MLKITPIDSNGQRTLVLEGKLVHPWVDELERTWLEARGSDGVQSISVDLKDVTVISEQGKALLKEMASEGTTFHCCRGVLTKHVVQQVVQTFTNRTTSGKRVL